jgi:hypothetical protein
MPKMAMDYSKTIMYKLCCNDITITDIYIGHTTNFIKRKNQHKTKCNNEKDKKYNLNVYQFIRNNGGWDNWSMVMIEEYNCNSKLEAEKRERELYEEYKATLNSQVPSRTNKEYYEDNKDKIKDKIKEYRKNNQDKIKEYKKEYRKNNQDKIKEKAKEYYENNQDKIKEKDKEYRKNNQDKIKEYKKEYCKNNQDKIKEKFNCDCGGCYTKVNKSTHEKTKKHQEWSMSLSP